MDEGRFMSVNEAIDHLWEASSIKVAELKEEKALQMKREEETRTNAKEEEETHTNAKEEEKASTNAKEENASVGVSNFFTKNTKLFAVCRFATDNEKVVYDSA